LKGPLASVIVAVYNGERFLAETLESVLAQDYDPYEVIVVDDGSEDGTGEVARAFEEVQYIRQENQGPSSARNTGLAAASGEFVAFFDSDDLMLPHKLSTQIGYLLAHPEVGCTLARQAIRVEEGVDPPTWLRRDRLVGDVAGVLPLSAVVRMADVERIGGFDPDLRFSEDLDLLFRLRAAGVRIEILPDVVMTRRVHGKNLTYQASNIRTALFKSVRGRIEAKRPEPGDSQ
jgi:glycosyltransferase involved in cell wall biosynthesis